MSFKSRRVIRRIWKLEESIRVVSEIAIAVRELKASREPPETAEKKAQQERAAKKLEELTPIH